ncbi:MAG TPA: PfkB family carbohydrate kinase, partial [Tepidisphaeraceae bacterium]|nr:PfkB family carbohydrate kinase [Tepidisphaeraceae bacterium]
DGQLTQGKPFKVKVVDTTAAGDAFTAGYAVSLAEGREPVEALRFANAAGALACTAFGAQPALPARAAVEALVAGRG